MENKIRTGVVGTGHLGKLHIKMLKQIPNTELIGVYDSNSAQADAAANELNVKKYDDLQTLCKDVDAVTIAATTTAHYEIAKKCLEAGKHVFIEKPITATIAEGEELVRLAKEKGLNIQVGHVERFNPALLSIDQFIMEPMFIQSDRLAQFNPRGTDVAVVLDLMIHDIDIILHLVKSDVKKIDANGVAVVSDHIDIANARIEFENGAVANVTASRISQKRMRKMRIFQKDTYVSLDFNTGVSELYRLVGTDDQVDSPLISYGEMGVGKNKKKLIYEQPEVKEVNALLYEVQLFVDSVQNKTKPIVSGEDGLKALKTAGIIMKKIQEANKNIDWELKDKL